MNVRELADRLHEALEGVPHAERPIFVKGWASNLPNEEKAAVMTLIGLFGFDIPRSKHVLVLIHGIRTAAVWQDLVEEAFDGTDIRVIPIGYEYHDAVRFLLPCHRRVVNYVRGQLRQVARDWNGAEISLIAHSFGTYITSQILRTDTDIRFKRIAFCGSVVPAKFKWASIPGLPGRDNFVNEVGYRDVWPVFARACGFGYGTSGSFGFRQAMIQDRFHNLDHSGFFDRSWIRRFWLPFIEQGIVLRSQADRPNPSLWSQLINVVSPKYLIPLILLLYVLCRYYPWAFG